MGEAGEGHGRDQQAHDHADDEHRAGLEHGAGTIEQSITACRMGGHISLIGILAGMKGELNSARLMAKQIRLIGITVGSREQQQDMVAAVEANAIVPVVDRSFALEQLAEAFRYQESGAHFGKIAVEY